MDVLVFGCVRMNPVLVMPGLNVAFWPCEESGTFDVGSEVGSELSVPLTCTVVVSPVEGAIVLVDTVVRMVEVLLLLLVVDVRCVTSCVVQGVALIG